jgi:putative ABC transport system ATP-binding protein
MLHTRDLVKIYRTGDIEVMALQNVNIDIEKGEYLAIMGPAGSGKSTLMQILGLIDSPTSGELFFMGYEISKMKERKRVQLRRGNIGFLFKDANLIEELSVYENVELPLIYQKYSRAERKQMVDEALKEMNLSHRSKHLPEQLSGEHQQKVAIARAIVTSPDLILADEPVGNLDSAAGDRILNILGKLNEGGTTVVIGTHSAAVADRTQRIIQLFDGHVITENIRGRL